MRTFSLFIALITSASLLASDLYVEYTKANISCFGRKDGSIELSIRGGKAPYTIYLNGVESQRSISDLSSGRYSIKVKDQKGSEKGMEITIEAPKPLTISYETKDLTLVDNLSGSMNVQFSGGTPWITNEGSAYFVRLDGQSNFSYPENINNGVHTLEIEDAAGCKLSVKVNLNVNVITGGQLSNTSSNNAVYNGFGNVELTVYKRKLIAENIPLKSSGVQQ